MLKHIIFGRNRLALFNEKFKKWFRFSKKERNGLMLFLALMVLFFTFPYLFPKKKSTANLSIEHISSAIEKSDSEKTIFSFDPNTLDKSGWLKLGVREKTVNTIIHYREKGGKFHFPEDIKKIYGLKPEDAERLIPFIVITDAQHMYTNASNGNHSYSSYDKANFPLEINHAGWQHYASIPGISSKLAQRIVHFRDAKHGFKSVEEVKKTYGIDETLFQKIKPYLRCKSEFVYPDSSPIFLTQKQTVYSQNYIRPKTEKININTASLADILHTKKVPKSVAEAIIIYREQHGNYASIKDIQQIAFINDDLFEKVAPYLKIED